MDIDKVTRLSTLSYPDLINTAKLNNIAIGISVSQTLTVSLNQSSSYTVGADTYSVLNVSVSIESKPTAASLHCYLIAGDYQSNVTASTSADGTYDLTLHFPTVSADEALLVVFARAPFDARITSYATYAFAADSQQTAPPTTNLALNPLNYALSFNESYASIEKVHVLSFSYEQAITPTGGNPCAFPRLLDHSPIVIVACGQSSGEPIEEWTSYPTVPLSAGSSFTNSERNVFPYVVTINGVLYRLDLTLGDVNP